ncbi:MAG TPA: antibiotic biosynthesis monooxygenase [Nocardioides sp.]|nr:antibiotic biosynthesis monooxygenase [Nocardioides sp.]
MLVVNRFREAADPTSLRADLELVHGLLAGKPGYVDGWIGRNLDDPDLWTLTTRWEHVGAYRRALSSYELKLQMPVLMRAIDEPSAYEVVEPNTVLNVAEPRVT